MTNEKLGKVIGVIFMLAGIGMVIGGFAIRDNSKKFYATAKQTTATIDTIYEYVSADSDHDIKHDVYISYDTEEGVHYSEVDLGWYQSGMEEGQTIAVYYDPDDPRDVRTQEGSMMACIVVTLLGVVFALVGGIFAFVVKLDDSSISQEVVIRGKEL